MGMEYNEALVLSRIRALLIELGPLVVEAALFPNPFGGSTDTHPVYFPLAAKMEFNAYLTKTPAEITVSFVNGPVITGAIKYEL